MRIPRVADFNQSGDIHREESVGDNFRWSVSMDARLVKAICGVCIWIIACGGCFIAGYNWGMSQNPGTVLFREIERTVNER